MANKTRNENSLVWLESLPSDVSQVFGYLAEHGTISEQDAVSLLKGGARAYRKFRRRLEEKEVC